MVSYRPFSDYDELDVVADIHPKGSAHRGGDGQPLLTGLVQPT